MQINRQLALALFAVSFFSAVWLIFSEAAWLHPEVLGSGSYVWLHPGQESFAAMLHKMLDWAAFDPNVNRVRPLNDATEVIDAIARPYITQVFGVQPGFSLSTLTTLIAAPAFLFGFLRRRTDILVALVLCAVFVSTIGFLSLTVSYWHPAKKLNLVFLCAALYFAQRMSTEPGRRNEWWLLGVLFAGCFADELGLATYAIVLILYWPTIVADRQRLLSYAALPIVYVFVSGVIMPAAYWLLSAHGIWNAVGDKRKFAVFAYLVSGEFYIAAAEGLARSFLSTIGVRTHTALTESIALVAIVALPVVHVSTRRLPAREMARDPFVLSTVALVAASGYTTLLDWFPFPHEVSYLGSFNYYYHSSMVVLVIVWFAAAWSVFASYASGALTQTAGIAAAAAVVCLNFAMFGPVNRLMAVIHFYPYSRATLFDDIANGNYAPKRTPDAEVAAFKSDLESIFAGRPNGFEPILQMVQRTSIMTDGHVKNLPHIFYPYRRVPETTNSRP
jgi:hypothetical protein